MFRGPPLWGDFDYSVYLLLSRGNGSFSLVGHRKGISRHETIGPAKSAAKKPPGTEKFPSPTAAQDPVSPLDNPFIVV
jgi:hypothetical protein